MEIREYIKYIKKIELIIANGCKDCLPHFYRLNLDLIKMGNAMFSDSFNIRRENLGLNMEEMLENLKLKMSSGITTSFTQNSLEIPNVSYDEVSQALNYIKTVKAVETFANNITTLVEKETKPVNKYLRNILEENSVGAEKLDELINLIKRLKSSSRDLFSIDRQTNFNTLQEIAESILDRIVAVTPSLYALCRLADAQLELKNEKDNENEAINLDIEKLKNENEEDIIDIKLKEKKDLISSKINLLNSKYSDLKSIHSVFKSSEFKDNGILAFVQLFGEMLKETEKEKVFPISENASIKAINDAALVIRDIYVYMLKETDALANSLNNLYGNIYDICYEDVSISVKGKFNNIKNNLKVYKEKYKDAIRLENCTAEEAKKIVKAYEHLTSICDDIEEMKQSAYYAPEADRFSK